jgi:hypothetical protein
VLAAVLEPEPRTSGAEPIPQLSLPRNPLSRSSCLLDISNSCAPPTAATAPSAAATSTCGAQPTWSTATRYQLARWAPDLFLFGSDGAGEAFAFDRGTDPVTVVMVPFVGFEPRIALGTFEDILDNRVLDRSIE